jgi:hypothetical protein
VWKYLSVHSLTCRCEVFHGISIESTLPERPFPGLSVEGRAVVDVKLPHLGVHRHGVIRRLHQLAPQTLQHLRIREKGGEGTLMALFKRLKAVQGRTESRGPLKPGPWHDVTKGGYMFVKSTFVD